MHRTGFVLFPNRAVATEALRLSEGIPNNKIILNLETTRPHVTILQTFFKEDFDYVKALEILKTYEGFRQEPRTYLHDVRFDSTHHLANVTWWMLQNSQWLNVFNRLLIETFSDYIIKPYESDLPEGLVPASIESFLKTGYSRNLDAYEPHITLGVTEVKEELPVSPLMGQRARFHELAYVKHGDHGTISEILASVKLPMTWD